MITSGEFQSYLQTICQRYEQWWTVDALTETIAIRQATFLFEQMVETEEKSSEGKPRSIPLPIFKGIQDYIESEHILLVGSPGIGKSTALLRCMVQFAEREREKLEPRIPVLVSLKKYKASFSSSEDPSGMLTLIRNSLPLKIRRKLETSEIEELLLDQRLILFLDGLNEMPADSVRTHLKAFREECQVSQVPLTCTTRELGSGDLGIKRRLKIQPLNPTEIDRFLQECLPDQRQKISQLLNRDNRELSRTPFMLWMLYNLFQKQGTKVETLAEALREFFRSFNKNYKEDVPVTDERRKDWTSWLKQLAFTMLNALDPTNPGLVISREQAKQVLDNKFGDRPGDSSRIEELLKYHVLESVSDEEISFHHQLIQEYYAAEQLLCCLINLSNKELKHCYLNYQKWTESIILMLSLIDEHDFEGCGREQIVRVVELALGINLPPTIDLMLGAKLAGAPRQRFHQETIALINALELKTNVQEEYCSGIESKTPCVVDGRSSPQSSPRDKIFEIAPHLRAGYEEGWLKFDVPYFHQSLRTRALNATSSNTAIPYLLRIVFSEDADTIIGIDIRDSAIKQLVSLNTEESHRALLQIFLNIDSHGKFFVANALTEANNSQCDSTLNQPLLIEEENRDKNVIQGIKKANQDREIRLSYPLQEEYFQRYLEVGIVANARASVLFWNLYMLWLLGDFWSFSVLMKLLKDSELNRYRSNFMMQFRFNHRNMNETNFYNHYLKAFEEANTKSVIYYFGMNGEKENQDAISLLIQWLKDDRFFNYRSDIIRALSKAKGNSNLLDSLFDILEESEDFDDTRMQIIHALKRIGTPEYLSRLVSYLFSSKLAETPETYEIDETLKAIAAIQSRYGFYNHEIYQHAQKLEDKDDFIDQFYKNIDKAIDQIQKNPELRQEDKEDRLTIEIVGLLCSYGYNANHDTKIGGHVDIAVEKNNLIWLGEAKIYKDNNYLWEGFQQLATRYSIGDSNQSSGGLLIYIFDKDAKSVMDKWQAYLLSKQLPDYNCRPCKSGSLAFISSHKHQRSGLPFHVKHIPVSLHFSPQDRSGRRSSRTK